MLDLVVDTSVVAVTFDALVVDSQVVVLMMDPGAVLAGDLWVVAAEKMFVLLVDP